MPKLDLPDLYTLDDLIAKYPHLSRDTMYDVLASGELRGFKIGRVWHIDPDDWRAFLDHRRNGRTDDGDLDVGTDAPVPASRRPADAPSSRRPLPGASPRTRTRTKRSR